MKRIENFAFQGHVTITSLTFLRSCIEMEAKRMEIAALLSAQHTKSCIAEHLKVSRMTVHRVVKRLKSGEYLRDQHR